MPLLLAVAILASSTGVVSSVKATPTNHVFARLSDIKPDIGGPTYVANVIRYCTNNQGIGSYATVQPTTVGMTSHGEFWCSVVAVNEASGYIAEVAVDITWRSTSPNWHTVVYFIYSDPSIYPLGQQFSSYDMGYSSSPQQPQVAVYVHSGTPQGTVWDYVVNNNTRATHDFGTAWTQQYVGASLESYAQPPTGTNGQTILSDYQISFKNTQGLWTATSSSGQQTYTTSGYKVSQSDSGNYHYWKSTAT
ncbi:MAG: hypothetical protein NWE98_02260 [Candidatus Bathyarchaeota archaeon]|nr:hypothetical protein [Candidatus Bathyarchaeota archaeon]